MAHWWQSESQEKRTLRRVMELAVELGRLPTFEETRNLDEGLVSDAAFYYGSYSKLCELVASKLYGHNSRTFPADVAKIRLSSEVEGTEVARQRRLEDYKNRLKELGMWPTDERRLIEPAPLPEEFGHRRMEEVKTQDNKQEIAVKGEAARPRTGMCYVEKNDQWSFNIDRDNARIEGGESDQKSEKSKHEPKTENIAKGVVRVAGKPRVTKDDCIRVIGEVRAKFGRLNEAEYIKNAALNKWPAMATMRKNVGPVREWHKYLEEGNGQQELGGMEVGKHTPTDVKPAGDVKGGLSARGAKLPDLDVDSVTNEIMSLIGEAPLGEEETVLPTEVPEELGDDAALTTGGAEADKKLAMKSPELVGAAMLAANEAKTASNAASGATSVEDPDVAEELSEAARGTDPESVTVESPTLDLEKIKIVVKDLTLHALVNGRLAEITIQIGGN